MSRAPDVTGLLLAWSQGDDTAAAPLMDAVYDELRRLARGFVRRERRDHALQGTVLVHDVYLKLVDQRRVQWQYRQHFFAVAAHAMRRALVDERARPWRRETWRHRDPSRSTAVDEPPATCTSPTSLPCTSRSRDFKRLTRGRRALSSSATSAG